MNEPSEFNEVVTSHQPKNLFKFYDWEKPKCGEAFGRRVLTERELWFARTRTFNDPPDSFVSLGQLFPESNEDQDHEVGSYQHSFCCFSLRWDSVLMWSHYSQNHKGYCVEFDVSGLQALFRDTACNSVQCDRIELRHVRYTTVPADPILHEDLYPKHLSERALNFFTTKSMDWAYEQEVRAIRLQLGQDRTQDDHGTPLRFDPQRCIKTVLLGRRISDKHKDEIRSCVESLSPDIAIEQCRRVKGAFRLQRTGLLDIKPGDGG